MGGGSDSLRGEQCAETGSLASGASAAGGSRLGSRDTERALRAAYASDPPVSDSLWPRGSRSPSRRPRSMSSSSSSSSSAAAAVGRLAKEGAAASAFGRCDSSESEKERSALLGRSGGDDSRDVESSWLGRSGGDTSLELDLSGETDCCWGWKGGGLKDIELERSATGLVACANTLPSEDDSRELGRSGEMDR
jgi:hypothetical protein